MKLLGSSNGRSFYHVDGRASTEWENELPMTNWLALPILNEPEKVLAERIARACLDKDVAYICSLGSACEMLHDWIDDQVLIDKIKVGAPVSSPDDFEHSPMTTWHNDFEEGVWFALWVAHDDYKEIQSVVCIDMSEKGEAERLTSLTEAINSGWLPSERD